MPIHYSDNDRVIKLSVGNILRGTINQASAEFEMYRGMQCTAITAVAGTAFVSNDPNLWETQKVDSILKLGNLYYGDSIRARKKTEQTREVFSGTNSHYDSEAIG